MTIRPTIAQLGDYFQGVHTLSFISRESLFDYDIIIVNPNHIQFHGNEEGWGNENVNRFKLDEAQLISNRIGQLVEFVQSGRKLIVLTPYPQIFWAGNDNYITTSVGMLPVKIDTEYIEGSRIEITAKGPIGDFLRKYQETFWYRAVFKSEEGESLAVIQGTKKSVAKLIDNILFLPMVNTDNIFESQFIEDLINVIEIIHAKEPAFLPSWSDHYFLPGEKHLLSTIASLEQQKILIEKNIVEFGKQLQATQELKIAFAGNGEPLENCVYKTLEALGFNMICVAPQRDDIIVEWNKRVMVVEVKGVNGSASEKHAAQLEKWVTEYQLNNDIKPKGLLVVNGFKETELYKRREPVFPNQMLNYSERREHCLITTTQLLAIYFDVLKNPEKKEDIITSLFQSTGVYKGYENWSAFIEFDFVN